MSFILVNNFNTTLSAASSSTATTFTVSSSANIPTLAAGEVLPITLNDAATRLIFEICYVTGISGNVLTVERAQEGTSAQNWNVGDFIWNGPTAGTALLTNMPNPFIIPNATANDNPVALGQFIPAAGVVNATDGTATSLSLTTPVFTAPSNGYFMITATAAYTTSGGTFTLSASFGSLNSSGEVYSEPFGVFQGQLKVLSGQQSSFTFSMSFPTSNAMDIVITVFFVPTL